MKETGIQSQTGNALIVLFFGITLLGLGSLSIAKVFFHAVKTSQSLQISSQLQNLRNTLMNDSDCATTLDLKSVVNNQVNCSAYSAAVLKNVSGDELGTSLPGNWRTFDNIWKFRTYCQNDALRIAAESIKPDPKLKSVIQYDDIIETQGGLCGRFFTANPCPTDEFSLGSTNGIPTCVRDDRVVDFSVPDTFVLNSTGTAVTQQVTGYGMCALINIEFTFTHDHGDHSHPIAACTEPCTPELLPTSPPLVTRGVDCQVFQLALGEFELMASTRATGNVGQDVQCEFNCYKFFTD